MEILQRAAGGWGDRVILLPLVDNDPGEHLGLEKSIYNQCHCYVAQQCCCKGLGKAQYYSHM